MGAIEKTHSSPSGWTVYTSSQVDACCPISKAEFIPLKNRVNDLLKRIHEVTMIAEVDRTEADELLTELEHLYLKTRNFTSLKMADTFELHARVCDRLCYWGLAAYWYERHFRILRKGNPYSKDLVFSLNNATRCFRNADNGHEVIRMANLLYRYALIEFRRGSYLSQESQHSHLLIMANFAIAALNAYRPKEALAMLENLPASLSNYTRLREWKESMFASLMND